MNKALNYNDAFTALEKLVAEIEDDGIQLDELAGKVVQANELIKYCDEKLRGIEADIKEKTGD
jgi:exodeoxyribonuclease VII small subunit